VRHEHRSFIRPLYWLAGKVFSIWARPAILPETPAEYLTDPDAEVCYVLESGGLADVLALERACATHGMPSPTDSFEYCGNREIGNTNGTSFCGEKRAFL
jgi:glycerol-3-phosphate O-acyltransferase